MGFSSVSAHGPFSKIDYFHQKEKERGGEESEAGCSGWLGMPSPHHAHLARKSCQMLHGL